MPGRSGSQLFVLRSATGAAVGPTHRRAYESWWSVLHGIAPEPAHAPPFSRGSVLMGFDEGRIDHHVIILGVFKQPSEHRFPNTIFSPPTEAFVCAFPVAVALGHIMPMRSTAQ